MKFYNLKKWVSNLVAVDCRIRRVFVWYLLFIMVSTRKHSLDEAAKFSGINKSLFSNFLKNYTKLSVYTLDNLSKRQAKQFSKLLRCLANNSLPWKIAILIDSTIQHRSSRHTENAKRFNHGKGFVIGHQWTNIVLIINDMIIPLSPIPFYSKSYCSKNDLEYTTENNLVVEYIKQFKLEDYIGPHNPKEVVVLADSGYDSKKIANAIIKKKWKFIITLKRTRSVKSQKKYLTSLKSKGWSQAADFFKKYHKVKWQTIRLTTNGAKKKRMDFRIRQIVGYLFQVGKVQLICSEIKNRPDGRKKYLASNDLEATGRQILMGYKIRWLIEIFHKEIKMHLGFEDVAARSFDGVKTHVHLVYCAYILLNLHPPGISEGERGVANKQRKIGEIVDSQKISRLRQLISQFGGVEKLKHELFEVLQAG